VNQTYFTNDRSYRQTYNGLEVTATKRMSNRWQMVAGYTWARSRVKGLSVNVNPNALLNVTGPLAGQNTVFNGQIGDRPHQFKLTGTSVNAEQSVAFLLETASGKTHWLRKGKEINGITLDSVEARRVVLKQGEETEELSLRTAPSPPAPRPTVAPAAAPGAQPAAPGQAAPTPPGMPAAVPPGFGSRSASDAGRYPAPLEAQTAAGTARVTAPATPADAAATAQRRRRFPNLPQQ